jgi:hypothetical protein
MIAFFVFTASPRQRAADPVGTRSVEASNAGEHAGVVAAGHGREVAVDDGKGEGVMLAEDAAGGVGNFSKKQHCASSKISTVFRRTRCESLPRTTVV